MAELTAAQRQLLVSGLKGAWPIPGSNATWAIHGSNATLPIPGSDAILPPQMEPYGFAKAYPELNWLPSSVAQAIAPNLGINFGQKGDFVTGTSPPFTNDSDPTMPSIRLPSGDQGFERQGQPWWHSERMFRGT